MEIGDNLTWSNAYRFITSEWIVEALILIMIGYNYVHTSQLKTKQVDRVLKY